MDGEKMPKFRERKYERTKIRKLWEPKEYPVLLEKGCSSFTDGRYGCNVRWVTLHHTYGSTADGAITWFKIAKGRKACSAHYVLGKDGKLYQLVNENDTAWHAGFRSDRQGLANGHSIGIEIVHRENEFTEDQYQSLAYFLPLICERHNIPVKIFKPYGERYADKLKSANALKMILGDGFKGIIGHCTISKRSCPGEMFRWSYLVELLESQGYK